MKKLRRRVEKFNGLSVGLDLHKRFIQVSVLDREGDEILAERIASEPASLTRLFDRLSTLAGAERGVRVAMEASGCFVWCTTCSRLGWAGRRCGWRRRRR